MSFIDLAANLARLRAAAPLVHNITNVVVANYTANALLAVGASPAMVQAEEEVGEFVRKANALVINIGTLMASQRRAMFIAANGAADAGVPWVLDPVAAGATAWRGETARELLAYRPTVLRGNASEIMALAGSATTSRGVDSTARSEAGIALGRDLARAIGTVVAVTGAVDFVSDGHRTVAVSNGHPMLTRVTGTGCTATALIGAFLGAGCDGIDAAVSALALLGVAAEIAMERPQGPGSLQIALLDLLHTIEGERLAALAKIALV